MTNIFYNTLTFIAGLFFLMLGIIGMAIPWDAGTRTAVIDFILENSISIILFGFGFLIIGITILTTLYFNLKKHYYYIRTGNRSVAVDETIVQEYISSYWQETFPRYDIPHRVSLKNNKIHVYADLPYMPKAQQKETLENIRNDFNELFTRVLGYRRNFSLTISFQKENKET